MTPTEKDQIEEALAHLISGRADKCRWMLEKILLENQKMSRFEEAKAIMEELYKPPPDVA